MLTHLKKNARVYYQLLTARCYQLNFTGVVVKNFPFSDSVVQAAAHKCSGGKKNAQSGERMHFYHFIANKTCCKMLHPVCHIISAIMTVELPSSAWCLASGNQLSDKQYLNGACNFVQSRETT